MTPCARRAADLTTINAFTKLHHFTRRALRNGKSAGCDLTGVRMRALRGLGGLLDNIPGKCRRTGTSSDTRGTGVGAPTIDRKSTRLNSSHGYISYAVFCLKTNNTF